MSQEEKEKIFNICMMLIGKDNFIRSTPSLKGFLWHVDIHFQLDALVYLLSELQHKSNGPTADKAWSSIEENFMHHPELFTHLKMPLYAAIANLALKSCSLRESREESRSSVPVFISQLRSQRTNMVQTTPKKARQEHDFQSRDSYDANESRAVVNSENVFDSSSTPFLSFIEMSPID
jgi:hypothetical protein